ncbi:MAG: putative quorum-sensing-regulated virulence factor, partial [Chitinophagaceae bacterium]
MPRRKDAKFRKRLFFHPKGKLGDLLATMFEIRINGLEYLLTPLK